MVKERLSLNSYNKEFFEFNAGYFPDNVIERWIIRDQKENLIARNEEKYHKTLSALDIASNGTLFGRHSGRGLFPALEVSYHFGRLIDDMNDGDAPLPEGFTDFKELVLYLREKIGDTSPEVGRGGAVEFLMKRSFVRLKESGADEKEISKTTEMFLTGMLIENLRRKNGDSMTEDGLTALYRLTFEPAEDVALMALGSKTRARDIPELSILQGKAYALDDLMSELALNSCNIPSGILQESGVSMKDLALTPELILNNGVIQKWIKEEKEICKSYYLALKKRKVDLKAYLMISGLSDGAKKRAKWNDS